MLNILRQHCFNRSSTAVVELIVSRCHRMKAQAVPNCLLFPIVSNKSTSTKHFKDNQVEMGTYRQTFCKNFKMPANDFTILHYAFVKSLIISSSVRRALQCHRLLQLRISPQQRPQLERQQAKERQLSRLHHGYRWRVLESL